MAAAALTPAMVAVLRAIVADAGLVDGRSWRATDALERRGLVKVTATRYGGQPVYELTDAGRAELEAIDSTPGMPGTVYGDGIYRPPARSS